MTLFPFSEDERRLIVAVRDHLKWVDAHPDRDLLIQGVQPEDVERVREFAAETIGLINGTLERRWTLNPKRMEFQQPVGWWTTEEKHGKGSPVR